MSTKLHPLRITDAHGKCIISNTPAAAFSLRDCATNEQNKLGSSNKTPKSLKHQELSCSAGVFPLITECITYTRTHSQTKLSPTHTMKSHAPNGQKSGKFSGEQIASPVFAGGGGRERDWI